MVLTITKEELEKLYISDDLSQQQIAILLGSHQVTIWKLLKKFNIPSKPRIRPGKHNSFYGKTHSEETKQKISQANLGKKSPNKGKSIPSICGDNNVSKRPEVKAKISKALKGRKQPWQEGEKNWNWRGGISYLPYSPEFNNELKKQIKKRDNYACIECGKKETDCIDRNGKCYGLQIHHIDYNKQNNNIINLVTLCNICHSKTNFKRKEWTKYYKELVGEK